MFLCTYIQNLGFSYWVYIQVDGGGRIAIRCRSYRQSRADISDETLEDDTGRRDLESLIGLGVLPRVRVVDI
jgi:hypothetical protein